MAGRTAGVVALRDGLYSACQAYANGIIGRRAYALILSQYGDLLVALAASGTSAAAPNGSTLPQQALQGLLTVCLTADDRTALGSGDDQRLRSACQSLLVGVIKVAPSILLQATGSAAPKPNPTTGSGTTSNIGVSEAVKALQEKLVAAGEKISVDGHFGPSTAAALRDYLKAHPNGLLG